MKKYLFVSLVASVILLGQSFKVEAPVLNPNPVPPASRVCINNCIYFDLYAIKVVFTGKMYSDNTLSHQCEDIVAYPSGQTFFNADIFYWVDDYTWVTAHVWVKKYSNSNWTSLGSCSTIHSSYTINEPNCLNCLTFSM